MLWTTATVAVCLTAVVLAGCAAEPPSETSCNGANCLSAPELKATEDTGVIRGVVFDPAIRPLAGVKVLVPEPGKAPRVMETAANGQFAFQGLAPGTYFVTARKDGFVQQQASVEVAAGVDAPDPVKIQLQPDPASAPYYGAYQFDGYIECSVSFVLAGLAACDMVPGLNDDFMVSYTLDRAPDWVQSEMVWDSTQGVSDAMNMVYSYAGEDALYTNYVDVAGPSPVVAFANGSLSEAVGLGDGTDFLIRVFNEPAEGTQPGDPTTGSPCVDRPVLGGCLTGVGATVEQAFTVYTHVFYGYTPPPGWSFGAANDVPEA